MAVIEAHNATIGIVQGVTWGTGVQATKKIQVQTLVINDAVDVRETGNHDVGFWASKIKQGHRNVTGTITVDCNFGGEWLLLYGLFAGTSPAPTEQTVGQGDYLHSMVISDDHRKFFCIAYEVEDDVVNQIASAKISQVTFAIQENGPLTATFQFTGTAHSYTSSTNNAQLNALALTQAEDPTIFNGANCYIRLANYSTSTALAAGNNLPVVSGSITLNRPITPYWAIRGSTSRDTYEPYSSALGSGEVSFTAVNMENDVINLFDKYISDTYLMAEVFIDGAQIGTGVNTSLKMQMPYLKIMSVAGYGIGGQAVLQQPTITMRTGIAPAAAAGMAGFTKALRVQSIDKRSTAYVT